jgi:hypothetical protein
MTTEFKPGTRVHVEFDAIVEEPNGYDYIKPGNGAYSESRYGGGYGFLKVRDTDSALYHYVWVGCGDSAPLITVVHQSDWEKHGGAQVGDIWEANGHEYFVYSSFDTPTAYPVEGTYFAHEGNLQSYSGDSFAEFKALSPRLVRRRGVEI